MSRIGNRILNIPEGVKLEIGEREILISNEKNDKLTIKYNGCFVKPKANGKVFTTEKVNNSKNARAQFGTVNALVGNALKGLKEPFKKSLEIVGVGYKALVEGNRLRLFLGYSHPVFLDIPSDVSIKMVSSLEMELSSYNKESLGSFASKIRRFRPPEPYKGKGVKYKGEFINRKVGKTSEGGKK